MKNAFQFTLKAFSLLRICKFLSLLFGHLKKRIDKKDNIILKVHDVTTWEQTIAIDMLSSISRINQTIKFPASFNRI